MSEPDKFGDILRAARHASGLSQMELSHRSGVFYRNIQYLEKNETNPSLRTMKLLANGLNAELVIGFKTSDQDQ